VTDCIGVLVVHGHLAYEWVEVVLKSTVVVSGEVDVGEGAQAIFRADIVGGYD
jgi:hypothetical protein